MNPSDLHYTKEHEWVRVERDTGVVGITDHAQDQLGDIVYVDLPKPGARFERGGTLGSVESVKAVSDIFAPVSGEIVEVNSALTTKPETLNQDPYGGGWLVKIKLSAPTEIQELLSASDYEKHVAETKSKG
jgi:glycine cleavage system H protein